MTRTRWKPGGFAIFASSLLFASVNAVSLTECSSENTGSGGQSSNSIYMTNGMCHNNCAGYAFAITQYQNCWCSNEAPSSTTDVGNCNQQCPGYPSEMCGNAQQGLFGYVALGPVPTGTMGAGGGGLSRASTVGGGGSSVQVSSFAPPSSDSPSPAPSTQVVVTTQAPQTVIQTQVSTYVPPPSSSAAPSSVDPTTSIQEPPTTEIQISSVQPTTILQDPSTAIVEAPASTVSSIATITPTPLVVTSAQAVTVSGSVITHFVTSTPSAVPASSQSNEMPKQTKSGVSSGTVAGATVGAIAGVALVAALILFCFRRRRQNGKGGDAEGVKPKRNASVLSRVGLLGNSNQADNAAGPTLPRIQTSHLPMDGGPGSALTMGSSQMSENRRFSRPLFSDTRLNPNALMTQTNISRTSVSTLQDNQDYSRPLEVRNPDAPQLRHV